MHHSSFDLRDLVSGALSRNKSSTSDDSKKVDMLCEGCRTKLGITAFKRKKQCGECHLTYCTNCLTLPNSSSSSVSPPNVFSRLIDRSTSKQYCRKCHVLRARPLCRADLQRLRVKDLQQYLKSHDVSCKGCVEKEDLVNLLIRYVGSSGSYNDVRQASSTTTSDNYQPDYSETQQPGYCSYSHTSRRSSDPSIHSPMGDTPRAFTNVEESNPTPTILEPQTSSNESRRAMGESVPEVSSPISENASISSLSQGRENVDTRLDVEEVTDWEDLGAEALELGPEPVVTEVDDEPIVGENGESCSRPSDIDNNCGLNENSDSGTEVHEQVEEMDTSVPIEKPQESPSQVPQHVELSSIKTYSDLEQLTVKQLKELLARNRVDFRGCVEKAELTERANRLWLENVQARKELENLSMDELCKICMDAPVECVMLECGHMATCTACGKQLSECPICRQYVIRVVRIFKA